MVTILAVVTLLLRKHGRIFWQAALVGMSGSFHNLCGFMQKRLHHLVNYLNYRHRLSGQHQIVSVNDRGIWTAAQSGSDGVAVETFDLAKFAGTVIG